MSVVSEETEISKSDVAPPVNVSDSAAVKYAFDDRLCKLVSLAGYKQDFRIPNLKLFLMALACSVTCYAQLGPHQFPEYKGIQIVSIFIYAFISLALQLTSVFYDKDIVIRTYGNENSPHGGLVVKTSMPRGQDIITVNLQCRDKTLSNKIETISQSVGRYFSKEGEIDERKLQLDLQGAILRIEECIVKKEN